MYRPPETLTAARSSSPPRRARHSEERSRSVRRSEDPSHTAPSSLPAQTEREPPTFTRHGERLAAPTRRRSTLDTPEPAGESSESDDSSDDEVNVVTHTPVPLREEIHLPVPESDKEPSSEVSDDEDFHVTMLDDSELELAPSDEARSSAEPQSSLPPLSVYALSPESASLPTTPAGESRDEVFSHALPQPSPPAREGGHAGELTLSLPYRDNELVSQNNTPAIPPQGTLPSDLFGSTAAVQSSLPCTEVEVPVPDMTYDVCVEVTSAPSHIASALFRMKHAGDGDDLEGFGQTTMMGLKELDHAWGMQSDSVPI
ncbi:hypothetical protein MCUN1_002907 [Malassezia cuniculi]|uniref:Uncharacterized protein n=1 Tax=Malassezia cuniculi TaxID=948313 RepID=A0AAF0ESL8_9BASI|nr:hypothetical protein MCUN1_002907 [Malassezia cuniculi]